MSCFRKRSVQISALLVFAALVVALAILAGFLRIPTASAAAPDTPAAVFNCAPSTVAAFTNRVHVSCNPAAGAITYFAYCSAKDPGGASRFLSVFTTAKAIGKNLNIYYNPNDTSGTDCGCQTGDCRVITGAEVRP
jgi:hypothetical protein